MAWKTTTNPRTEFVTIRLTKDEAEALDAEVSATGARSRSEYVRDAVGRSLNPRKRKQKKTA